MENHSEVIDDASAATSSYSTHPSSVNLSTIATIFGTSKTYLLHPLHVICRVPAADGRHVRGRAAGLRRGARRLAVAPAGSRSSLDMM